MTNPYNTPSANLTPDSNEQNEFELHEPQSVPSSRGTAWISESFQYFKKDAAIWVVMMIVGGVLLIALNAIPFVNIFASLLTYVFTGGLMLGLKAQHDGEPLKIGHLFACFQNSLVPLLGLAAIAMVYGLICGLIAFGSVYLQLFTGDQAAAANLFSGSGILTSILILLILILPLMMAVWYAPVLIVINKVPVMQAIVFSIQGCLKNLMPLTVAGLLFMLLFIVGAIPVFLGLLIVMPMFYATIFISYKEIFID